MTLIWSTLILISVIYSIVSGTIANVGSAAIEGAASAVTLAIGILGITCLWCGILNVMKKSGMLSALSKLINPILMRLFRSAGENGELSETLSAGFAANFLGLGNAATPLGIKSASLMYRNDGIATDEMCMLIVLNTASIQFIPTTVAAIRSTLGSTSPFDILPAVWLTSLCSVACGIIAAKIFGKIWKN